MFYQQARCLPKISGRSAPPTDPPWEGLRDEEACSPFRPRERTRQASCLRKRWTWVPNSNRPRGTWASCGSQVSEPKLVRMTGLEPALPFSKWILNPPRLPFHHIRKTNGQGDRIRTCEPRLSKNRALNQAELHPETLKQLVRTAGIEPALPKARRF